MRISVIQKQFQTNDNKEYKKAMETRESVTEIMDKVQMADNSRSDCDPTPGVVKTFPFFYLGVEPIGPGGGTLKFDTGTGKAESFEGQGTVLETGEKMPIEFSRSKSMVGPKDTYRLGNYQASFNEKNGTITFVEYQEGDQYKLN